MIAGLITPHHGNISANGNTLFDSVRSINASPNQRRIGYVFQDNLLFPHLSVEGRYYYTERQNAAISNSRDDSALKDNALGQDIDEIENDKLVALPEIDSSGKLIGIVHLIDLVIAKDKTIEKIVKPCKYVSLESTLDEALAIMAENDIDFAPVVENGVYLGVVTLEAEIKAYRDALRKIYGH